MSLPYNFFQLYSNSEFFKRNVLDEKCIVLLALGLAESERNVPRDQTEAKDSNTRQRTNTLAAGVPTRGRLRVLTSAVAGPGCFHRAQALPRNKDSENRLYK